LKFWHYDTDRYVVCSYKIDEFQFIDFNYYIKDGCLNLRSILLPCFEEDRTQDVLILASHFNSLLNYGVVRVSIRNNTISLTISKDLLIYSLYSDEIESRLLDILI